MNIEDDMTRTRQKPSPVILSGIAQRRLSNQIDRGYRRTFGARAGLRAIVESVAREMLRAGGSRDTVATAITCYLVAHPARLSANPAGAVSDDFSASMLTDLVQQCVEDVTTG
jgi:hypothetical protein